MWKWRCSKCKVSRGLAKNIIGLNSLDKKDKVIAYCDVCTTKYLCTLRHPPSGAPFYFLYFENQHEFDKRNVQAGYFTLNEVKEFLANGRIFLRGNMLDAWLLSINECINSLGQCYFPKYSHYQTLHRSHINCKQKNYLEASYRDQKSLHTFICCWKFNKVIFKEMQHDIVKIIGRMTLELV